MGSGDSIPLGYSRTPTPLPPAPRRVRGGLGGGIGCGRIFILPHFFVGIGLAFYFVLIVLWACFGTDIDGQVTGVNISHSAKHGDSYFVKYSFEISGTTQKDSDGVSRAIYDRFKNAASMPLQARTVQVRYFALGPLRHSGLDQFSSVWAGVWPIAIFALIWNGLISIFVYLLWIMPLRIAMLYKYGDAVEGKLLSKRVARGKSASYYAKYSFKAGDRGEKRENETQVWNDKAWKSAQEGQAVTVIFNPRNPKRSAVYELTGYRVDSAIQTPGLR